MRYAGGELRAIKLGRTEIIRRVHIVFQDRNWTARPWVITEEAITGGGAHDHFSIKVTARGTFDAEPFTYTSNITGQPDGTITFAFTGQSSSPFLRNRLGLCVLHPIDGLAGQPCTIEEVTGVVTETVFPLSIAPHQPFMDVRAITHQVVSGVSASIRFTGETFETEDHRNWSDASFKTYCTPISQPFPVTVEPGRILEQSVTLRLPALPSTTDPGIDGPITVTIDSTSQPPALPRIGFQLDTDGHTLSGLEIARLRALQPAHLRVDIDASTPTALERLREGAREASALGARLIPAIFVAEPADLLKFSDSPEPEPAAIYHWLVFEKGAAVTGSATNAAARTALGPNAVIGVGTNLYFTELNRGRPDPTEVDILNFSLNPQVHSSDDDTIVENLAALAVIADCARRICGQARITVSPVTLRPRFNPNATAPEVDVSSTALPSDVDARQSSGLGAAWTVISLKYLAEGGHIDAVTYYELTGWKGLMERAEPRQPNAFRSTAGEPFPIYDVFAALVGFTHVRPCTSSDPLRCDALLVESEGARRLLLANFTAETQSILIRGLVHHPADSSRYPGAHELAELTSLTELTERGSIEIEAAPSSVTIYDLAPMP